MLEKKGVPLGWEEEEIDSVFGAGMAWFDGFFSKWTMEI